MMMMMMMMMPTKIFSKMYFVWTREIGQQARTRIRRAFGDDGKDVFFFFFSSDFFFKRKVVSLAVQSKSKRFFL